MVHRTMIITYCLGIGLLGGTYVWAESGPAVSQRNRDRTTVVEGSKVTMQYEITFQQTQDPSIRDVSQFVQGQHQVLPTIERQVAGMKAGEGKSIDVSVEDGFGPYDEQKKKQVERRELAKNVKPGDVIRDRNGQPATVIEVTPAAAVLDYNHPLAGKPFTMEVRILTVDNPS